MTIWETLGNMLRRKKKMIVFSITMSKLNYLIYLLIYLTKEIRSVYKGERV